MTAHGSCMVAARDFAREFARDFAQDFGWTGVDATDCPR
jgi:hypothetical protein